jgi:hypothetical protein
MIRSMRGGAQLGRAKAGLLEGVLMTTFVWHGRQHVAHVLKLRKREGWDARAAA